MNLQLKQPNGPFPAGGWPFSDKRTNRAFNGMDYTLDMLVMAVIDHRKRNPNLYPPEQPEPFNRDLVMQEILRQKQTTNPELFVGFVGNGTNGVPVNVAVSIGAPKFPCTCGKNDWEPTFCPTCSGRRVTGYTCKACGQRRNP